MCMCATTTWGFVKVQILHLGDGYGEGAPRYGVLLACDVHSEQQGHRHHRLLTLLHHNFQHISLNRTNLAKDHQP